MKRHGLLIVDDEKEILRSLTLTFAEDYAVFTASSGAEALEILEKQEIALVIADQRMPVMTGAELLERVFQINSNIIRIPNTTKKILYAVTGIIPIFCRALMIKFL